MTAYQLVPLQNISDRAILADGCDTRDFYAVLLSDGELYHYHRTDELVLYQISTQTIGFASYAIRTPPLSAETDTETLLIAL